MIDFDKIDMKENFLNGDHSFSMWFKIMWKNWYIQLFILALLCIVGIVTLYGEKDSGFYIALVIPIVIMLVISYKGFYQFWNDLKNNSSR